MKLFISTFLMIFLAELGDKTQLSVIGRAAEPAAKWTVFTASSLALVLSTLLAVQAGAWLTRHVDPRYVKIAAGVLFLGIGGLVLIEGLRPARAAVPAVSAKPLGALGRFVLSQASRFEQSAFSDYRELAARASRPDVRETLLALAGEEQDHFRRIADLAQAHAEAPLPESVVAALPSAEAVTHDVAAHDDPILGHAIEHETATAAFYAELARGTALPALKRAFAALAAAEQDHVARLQALQSA